MTCALAVLFLATSTASAGMIEFGYIGSPPNPYDQLGTAIQQ
jgi:hypothetical protein